jgi:hypothetical protein
MMYCCCYLWSVPATAEPGRWSCPAVANSDRLATSGDDPFALTRVTLRVSVRHASRPECHGVRVVVAEKEVGDSTLGPADPWQVHHFKIARRTPQPVARHRAGQGQCWPASGRAPAAAHVRIDALCRTAAVAARRGHWGRRHPCRTSSPSSV